MASEDGMISPDKIETLIKKPESDRIEKKESLSDKDKIRQTICAFANDLPNHDKPGYLLVGICDDETFSGVEVTDKILRDLSDLRSDGNILPPPVITVEKANAQGYDVAVVAVQPSRSPPVRCRGRTYVRVGPTTRVANGEEERRLSEKRRHKNTPFDQQPQEEATLDDLDLEFFNRTYLPGVVDREALRANERLVGDRLISCRLLAPDGRTPTIAGILILGIDPKRWIPGAYIQFLRVDGSELSDPIIDSKELSSNLNSQASLVADLLKLNIHSASNVGKDFRRQETLDYPDEALRELVFNALIHRTYEGTNAPVRISWFDDRIEITSPGGLFGNVTPENFGQFTDYRNPTIAEAMRALGYVEKFGVGVQRARKLLEKNGNPPPDFNFDEQAFVLVTVKK
ncbi:MAG: ATP-binding protein [Nitrospinales bacterium]